MNRKIKELLSENCLNIQTLPIICLLLISNLRGIQLQKNLHTNNDSKYKCILILFKIKI